MASSDFANSDEGRVHQATAEIAGVADVFRRLSDSCWMKCIATIREDCLTPGEASCIDRCVAKYQEVQKSVVSILEPPANAGKTDNHVFNKKIK